MLPSCREVAEQLSNNIDESCTGIAKLKLKLHLWICRNCRHYEDQIGLSAKAINLMSHKNEPCEEVKKQAMQHFRNYQEKSGEE